MANLILLGDYIFHTVDGKNPKQPPEMYQYLVNNGKPLPTSTGSINSSNSKV